MIYTTAKTKSLFLLEIDKFGDSFTTDATVNTIREVIIIETIFARYVLPSHFVCITTIGVSASRERITR